MTRPIIIRSPPLLSLDKRQPLLSSQDSSSSRGGGVRKARLAEVAGGATAECAAVACCCPCGIVNLLVLAVYKVPAGLCRKALRKKRRNRLTKKGLLPSKGHCSCDEIELIHSYPISSPIAVVGGGNLESDKDALELEKEMWDKFYGAGFWRSPSQRAEI
ncbi:uncharacterized protein LOC107799622 [Nicotiana tabacum]|uniref:Uncharacterized protein LOC107799622 n=2 Tax=Nicotiana TaxID=4085 RepID=A0A1S4ANJ9_TOBAC|nr:PREDICTED: uncharacterized protein LOC104240905 [Nicotiana sylvestris]XP_016478251.1 PREDICTED: uncharacterized protein LOC107799622 [Nicotiana tabacum]